MPRARNRVVLAIVLVAASRSPAQVYSHLTPVSDEHMARIEAAAPARASATPLKPRRLLVYSYAESFHSSVPYGARAFAAMGRKSGAFEAVFSSDTASFEPEALAKFDAVFLNNVTPVNKLPKELFLPNCGEGFDKLPPAEQAAAKVRNERLKKSLMDFVRSGKGLCGNHSTTDCFYEWREFGEMIGGYFDGHPWHERVPIENVDPASSVTQAFGGKSWEIVDEIYQFKETYTRDALHILTRLDPAWEGTRRAGLGRKDGDFAVSWIREWGKGRVFYCALGHREDVYFDAVAMAHFLDGIQFALGDLPADARPSASLPPQQRVYGEWRIRVKPDRGAEYAKLIEERGLPLFREAGGRAVGWWNTLVGDLYEQVTIWEYDDLAAFEKAVRFLGSDDRFHRFAAARDPLLAGEDSRFLRLAALGEKPSLPVSASVVVHETHRVPLDRAPLYWKAMAEVLPILKRHGFRLAGPFEVVAGEASEVTCLWLHGSLAEREARLAQLAASADGQRVRSLLADAVQAATTRVLLPVSFLR